MAVGISGRAWLRKGSKAWLSATHYNAIIEIDICSGKTVVIGENPEEPIKVQELYASIFCKGEKLFFSPAYANDILVCSRSSGQCDRVVLPEFTQSVNQRRRPGPNYWTAFQYGKSLYVFGYGCARILKIDMETYELKVISSWLDEIDGGDGEGGFITVGYVIKDGKAYLPLGDMPALLMLDLSTDKLEIRRMDCSLTGFCSLGVHKNEFYLPGYKGSAGKMLIWNQGDDTSREATFWEKAPNVSSILFYPPIYYKGDIYIFPAYVNRSFVVDAESHRTRSYEAFDRMFLSSNEGSKGLQGITLDGGRFIFQTWSDYTYYQFNPSTEKIEWKKSFYLRDAEYEGRLKDHQLRIKLENGNPIWEQEGYLRSLLRICRENTKNSENFPSSKKAGAGIYRWIRAELGK